MILLMIGGSLGSGSPIDSMKELAGSVGLSPDSLTDFTAGLSGVGPVLFKNLQAPNSESYGMEERRKGQKNFRLEPEAIIS
jgi:hypothetical protein